MKSFVILFSLLLSLNSFSAEHGYWIEQHVCGEIDPYVVGDACVVEVANDDEHFIIIVDIEHVVAELGDTDSLEGMDVLLEKKDLKRATKKQVEALKDLVSDGLKVFTIKNESVTFTKLEN